MCIILDVNCISKFKNPADEDMEPVWDWLERKNGKIVYAYTEQFNKEWEGRRRIPVEEGPAKER